MCIASDDYELWNGDQETEHWNVKAAAAYRLSHHIMVLDS
jgi:hypothetical protein